MKYNKNTQTEKPVNEMPYQCKECPYFSEEGGGICKANDDISSTSSFSRPADRPLPLPFNCYWWYASSVWSKVSPEKQNEYAEERLHMFTASRYLKDLTDKDERRAFIDHLFRGGGGGLIDFNLYPRARQIYEEVKKL